MVVDGSSQTDRFAAVETYINFFCQVSFGRLAVFIDKCFKLACKCKRGFKNFFLQTIIY